MLHNEYGDTYENPATKDNTQTVMACRNPLLAKIHPTDTLKLLKEQLKAYCYDSSFTSLHLSFLLFTQDSSSVGTIFL
jgi:hypothetical protein